MRKPNPIQNSDATLLCWVPYIGGKGQVKKGTRGKAMKRCLSGISLITAFCLPIGAQWTAGSGGAIYYNGGSVGIGTTSPASPLDVRSSSRIASLYGTTSNNQWVELGNSVAHMNLGVGSSGATAGVPYIWSTNGSFFIGNDGAPTVLVKGGNVGIGTASPQYPLAVNGTIQAKEIIVNTGWSDYVFDAGYRLQPLESLGTYIKENHHLPGIPSDAEVREQGVSLGDMQSKLLAKVEELTLRLIQLDAENKQLAESNKNLEKRVVQLEK